MDFGRTLEKAIGAALMAITIALIYWLETMEVMHNSYTFDDFNGEEEDGELEQVKGSFEVKEGFPNCCGTIDVTHINMDLPSGEVQAHWFDRNHNYSMTLQAIVNSDMRSMDILCGMPGVCNDIRILRNSTFYMRAQSNAILNGMAIPYGKQHIQEYILGDGGYLNLPWLVISFPASDIDEHTQKFNYKLSSIRIVVERAFGCLKQMWGYLH
ncbi:hypothetical protein L7F22_006095 [Adiantum nelumboides]|nr:hypothetical protein [Adiantum nelumboides]